MRVCKECSVKILCDTLTDKNVEACVDDNYREIKLILITVAEPPFSCVKKDSHRTDIKSTLSMIVSKVR